ncbi:Conserved hypothetical protein [Bradyrhizobium sp. ORS 285]|uniref:hypothetical protein n=1 Tax=Bradyrhizobium sp. ORS 285 TaxID=115808 RepID=UPI0002407840|nr:hypothetical protein [Bradyrhizobium sp. ORS 285]CCD84423.1 conserved hypothetical protein [Bradyrhizobium sp. ORS 285]SMX57066.1 Conserved hypothetical protein [Bradyrhizobium sp. ORS 285]
MIHRGVQYTVVATAEPDIWEWRYEFGDQVKTGRTQTRLAALAARRVKSKIDAALRASQTGSVPAASVAERMELAKATSHGLT